MIARGVDRDAMLAEAPPKADLYVVEISSAKRLTVGDTCIQLNYFANEYRAFFDNKARVAQFWSVGRTEDQARIDAFLAEAWGATIEQQQESAILRQVRMTLTSEDEMRADIRTLIAELPAVLFITHVDARKPNGDTIASRSSFIEAVARVVREEGGTVYNPTARMIDVGQEAAIEDFSDSLAHFTEEFSKIVFADWFDLAIGPVMDRCIAKGGAPAVTDILVPHVDAMLTRGNLDDLDARLTRLSDQMVLSLGAAAEGRYLRFTAQLEVPSAHADEVTLLKPRILDVLNGYLRAVDPAELEDPAALVRLRAQMLRRIQIVTGEGRVRDLLVTEFVLN